MMSSYELLILRASIPIPSDPPSPHLLLVLVLFLLHSSPGLFIYCPPVFSGTPVVLTDLVFLLTSAP